MYFQMYLGKKVDLQFAQGHIARNTPYWVTYPRQIHGTARHNLSCSMSTPAS